MALLDIFKKKPAPSKSPAAIQAGKEKPAKKAKPAAKSRVAKAEKTEGAAFEAVSAPKKTKKEGYAWKALKTPHVTEKATDLTERNQYIFKVFPQSNKVEIKNVIESVDVLDSLNANRHTLNAEKCSFSYRHSVFKENPNLIILSATLKLQTGDSKKSQSLIAEYAKKRAESQDIGEKCAGCIFKNVEWSRKDLSKARLLTKFPELKQFSGKSSIPAGFLIDHLGLKGRKIGGAEISHRHANYFINIGGATSEDVLMLVGLAKERVQNHYGIYLEKEIHLLT